MTYKDHGEIATILKDHIVVTSDEDVEIYVALTQVAERIADYCQKDNPRFDRDRFMITCGIGLI